MIKQSVETEMPKVKNTSNFYFTKYHEDAIVRYVASLDKKEREVLYIKDIAPVLSEMVDKIIYTYKFTTLPNIDCLKEECKVWLVTVLDKFSPDKGFKAFSYFSVITKNWFIHRVKKCSLQSKKELIYDELPHEIEQQYMSVQSTYTERRNADEFWSELKEEIEYWASQKEELKPNEELVLNAIIVLMENVHDIEIFNRKACYLYIRELTNLSSKQIVVHLSKLKERYLEFCSDWEWC
jgi:hypothetical protein